MKRIATVGAVAALGLVLLTVGPADAQDTQSKAAAIKQAAAKNQEALHHYTWIEKTEVSVKGEVKSTKIQQCQYGPDGKVQKTLLSEPPKEDDGGGHRRGRRHRVKEHIVEHKKEEMSEEMKAAGALVHQYLPPDPAKIQAAMSAGRISIVPGAGTAALTISDYVKAGDSFVLTLDSAHKAMQKIDVNTYLEKPDDKVTLDVQMASLPDGTSHTSQILLSVPGDHIDVKITNTNYQKIQ
jgi:hypothetical protein